MIASLFAERRSRLTLAAIALLIPTAVFWTSLVLKEALGWDAPFDVIFLPLDRSLAGKLATAVLVLGMPAAAALCTVADVIQRQRRGEQVVWLGPMIIMGSVLSAATILLHAIVDR